MPAPLIPESHPFADATLAAKDRAILLGRQADSRDLTRLQRQIAAQRRARRQRRAA
jgi:hypothetical protein